MNAFEIRNIAIDSSDKYYNWLTENNKGTQEVDVFSVDYLLSQDLLIKLRLSAKLFDQESIFFRLLSNNQIYDNSKVKIVEYDSDKNILLIKPTELVRKYFENLRPHDIKVISDLKFLVKRVQTWYEKNGASINVPVNISTLKKPIDNNSFLPNLSPSSNQIDSLKSIFSNPFTYVWGAPGTGKTQFVLAYAVLHYIKNNKRVAILAPTNNSLEQVLRGVIKMTDLDHIPRKQIIRLGTPSRNFAEEFPEVCEEKGVQKRLEEIDKQINILQKIVSYHQDTETIKLVKQQLTTFNNFSALETKLKSVSQILDEASLNLQKKTSIVSNLQSDLKIEQVNRRKAQNSIHSFSHKMKKVFTSDQTSQEKRLADVISKVSTIQKSLQQEEQLLTSLQQDLSDKSNNYGKISNEVNQYINSVKKNFSKLNEFNSVCSKLVIGNWREVKNQIEKTLQLKINQNVIDDELRKEYSRHSKNELEIMFNKYLSERNHLATMSTQERLVNVNVIACTLDGYIGKYVQQKMSVDHIFMDEAGYANIIKALTLFNHSVPITFLGDHKQLPPVCELSLDKVSNEEEYQNIFIWSQSSIFIDSIFNNSRDVALHQYINNLAFQPKLIQMSSLDATYRFGSNLTAILGRHIYDSSFKSNNPDGKTNIFYIHATKTEEYKSRISLNEVDAISKLVNNIKRNGNNDFIILTPYKKQVKLLGKHLPVERNELKILTVHGSQGREWHTVILSVVDTTDKWFVDSLSNISRGLNLINTAVSRAKNQLIIVCDTEYWFNQDGQLITDLIVNCKEYS